MLTQSIHRRDAETPRVKRNKTNRARHYLCRPYFYFSLSLRLCVSAVILFAISCTSKPTDLRTLTPADSLIYLETNDVAAAIQPVVDSDAFNKAAKSKPDLSAINGVQLAVAVTG